MRARAVIAGAGVAGVIGVVAGCDSTKGTNPTMYPAIARVSVSANPNSVLSSVVTFAAAGGDSARIVSRSPGDVPPPTPYQPIVGVQGAITTLGLLPSTTYTQVLQVTGRGRVASDSVTFTTGALPAYVQGASLTYTGAPTSGYTLVSPLFTPDTGIIVVFDSSGDIVTNAHVVGAGSGLQVLPAASAEPIPATLVGIYQPDDLAVIRVSDSNGLRPAKFGDSGDLVAGDIVLAIGNPLGLSSSVTEGIVSAVGRVVSEPGSHGSPGAVLHDTIQTSVGCKGACTAAE